MKVPQGVEKVVALATLSPDWRAKVLADPAAAAQEAGIELSDSEREILRAVSARMLAGMIDSFGKSVPRPAGLGKLAAGAAVASLLAAGLAGCGDDTSMGCRSDVPKPKAQLPSDGSDRSDGSDKLGPPPPAAPSKGE